MDCLISLVVADAGLLVGLAMFRMAWQVEIVVETDQTQASGYLRTVSALKLTELQWSVHRNHHQSFVEVVVVGVVRNHFAETVADCQTCSLVAVGNCFERIVAHLVDVYSLGWSSILNWALVAAY